MNYKRLFLTFAGLLFAGSLAFAEIAIKDLGDGNVDITFTFKDDTAPEMGVIGSFDNWTQPGEMMTKNAAGLWEKTIRASTSDAITYKFLSKGTWTLDEKAPDKKDDGYGGFNGFVPVADILSGLIPAVPGAPPVVAQGAKKLLNQRPRVTFGTQTHLETGTKFSTSGNGFDVTDSAINAKSLWKFDGDLAPGMPGHLELTVFNGSPKVYDTGATPLDLGTGLQRAGAGFLLNPFYYLGGNKKPTLDKVAFGFDTPYLVYETGYANSPFPAHKSVVWDTVSLSAEQKYGSPRLGTVSTSSVVRYGGTPLLAGNGYSSFVLGPKAREWGDFTVSAGLVPNFSNFSNGANFGLQTWAGVDYLGAVRAEVQYEMKASKNSDDTAKTDATQFFTKPAQQNIILGVETYFLDGFQVKGQLLLPQFVSGTTLDRLALKDKVALKVIAGYSDVYKDSELLLGWSHRGGYNNTLFSKIDATAQLLYLSDADNDSVLGPEMTQSLSVDGFQNFGYWGVLKLNATATVSIDTKISENVAAKVRPGFVLNLDKLNVAPLSVEFFGQALMNTKPAIGTEANSWDIAGAKVSLGELLPGVVQSLDVYYRADNSVKNALFNTLLAEAKSAGGVRTQAGLGLRSGSVPGQTLSFSMGANYQLPAPELRQPTVYAQLVYNMDPFNADGTAGSIGYDLTDFGPTNGRAAYDGQGALRLGVSWNY